MGCISRPGVKHNPYCSVSVNRTVIAENGGLFPQSYGMLTLNDANAKFGYYTDDFTISISGRTNGEDLYYEITGPGAVTARFYQSSTGRSGVQGSWSINPDGSSATVTTLTGRIGNIHSTSWTKAAFASPTTSNTNDSATSTTFSINIRTRNATTGTILATSPTITCYRFRFVIDAYVDGSAGVYQNATTTIPSETGTTPNSRNYYCRILLPLNTVYNVLNLFNNIANNGVVQVVAPSTGTAATPGSDLNTFMSWNGWWDAYGGQYIWAAGGVQRDAITEPIEYFRYQLNWTAYYGLQANGWTVSQDHAIAANTT